MAKRKAATETVSTDDFEPDAIALRTTDQFGRSYGGFEWPREVGAIVTCPDWSSRAECGNGLHGLLDGIGDHGLLNADSGDRLWWIVGVRRDECVRIDDAKVKFPRCKVIYVGNMAGALSRTPKPMNASIMSDVRAAVPPAVEASTATTGDGSAAATTGYGSAAATTGYGSAAATTGDGSAAATTGKNSVAAALGRDSTATAGAGGAIMLAAYDDDWNLVAVFASLVGENGIEPGATYRLSRDGKPERIDA